MKRIISTLAVLVCLVSSAAAQPHITQAGWLKLLGEAKTTPLDQLDTLAVKPNALTQFKIAEDVDGNPLICGHPNDADPDVAFSTPAQLNAATNLPIGECEDYIEMHRRLLSHQASAGAGSWPAACNPQYPEHHSVTYFVDRKTFPSHYKTEVTDGDWREILDAKVWHRDNYHEAHWNLQTVEDCKRVFSYRDEQHAASAREAGFSQAKVGEPCNLMDAALLLMEETSRRYGCAHIEVYDGPNGDHNIHILSQRLSGSIIGVAWFNNGRCGDHVNHKIDSGWRPDLHNLALLFSHEGGHNNNLQHQFGRNNNHEIMSYDWDTPDEGFSTGEPEFRNGRAPSWTALTRFYQPAPVPVDGDTDPPPPVDPPGDPPFTIGERIIQIQRGYRITFEVTEVEGDDGPGIEQRIAAEVEKIEDYDGKDMHQEGLAILYEAVADSILAGDRTFEKGVELLIEMRELFLGDDLGKWSGVFDVADSATSAEALLRVADGLRPGEAGIFGSITKIITQLIGGDEINVATIIKILLTLLGGFNAEAEKPQPPPEQPPAVQKLGWRSNSHWESGKPLFWRDDYALAN